MKYNRCTWRNIHVVTGLDRDLGAQTTRLYRVLPNICVYSNQLVPPDTCSDDVTGPDRRPV